MKFGTTTVRIIFVLIVSVLTTCLTQAQVGIGTAMPAASSILDVDAGNKGILIPRVAISSLTDQASIDGALVESLLVFNTNAGIGKGFYYWSSDDTEWKKISSNDDMDHDWYAAGTTTAPDNIDDKIWTSNDVGIGTDDPDGPLHVFEQVGTSALNQPGGTEKLGSMILEHGNNGGSSSIVFRSAVNSESDYAFINFEDDGGTGSSPENSLLTIGIENDEGGNTRDDIKLAATGEVKVSIGDPAVLDYHFTENAFSPETDGAKDLGSTTSHWDDIFLKGNLLDSNQAGNIGIGLGANRDYVFTDNFFYPAADGVKNLGASNFRWNWFFATNANLTGNLQLEAYGNGNKGLTPATFTLGVDANGNVVEVDAVDAEVGDSAKYSNTDVTTNYNINNAGNEANLLGTQIWNDNAALYTIPAGSANDMNVNSDGRYHIIANISFFSPPENGNGFRQSVEGQIEITNAGGTTYVGSIASTGYIRNTDGHFTSSIHINEVVNLQAGDDISIFLSQGTNDVRIIRMRSAGTSNFYIEKIK